MNNDNKDIRQETDNKPIIDLLALWEEVEEMIQENVHWKEKKHDTRNV